MRGTGGLVVFVVVIVVVFVVVYGSADHDYDHDHGYDHDYEGATRSMNSRYHSSRIINAQI
jgi:hypothetical protein